MQGPQGQARFHQGRRVRARHPRGSQIPPVQIRHRQGPQGLRGPRMLDIGLRRQELPPGRVHNHLQGHRQRHLHQQDHPGERERQDRHRHEQRHRPPAAEALVRREADPDPVLRHSLPRAPELRRYHRRARDIAPRELAAEARGLLHGHLQGQEHPDDRIHTFAADHPRQVGSRQGAEARGCASS